MTPQKKLSGSSKGRRFGDDAKEQAFRLYCDGVLDVGIAEKIGASVKTIRSWVTKYKWVERRREIGAKVKERTDQAVVDKVSERLQEHDRAARSLRAGALAALREELKSLDGKDSKAPPPDPLALQRISVSLKTALQLERQALGLRDDEDSEDGGPMRVYDAETLRAIYEKAMAEIDKLKPKEEPV